MATSWSTRARPRVESFSSRETTYEGHITAPDAVLSAMHFPTPVQRWTAPENDPASWVSRSVVRSGRGGVARRRSESNGAGSTSTPGFSRLSGSKIRLACCISAIACGEYIRGSSSERARPSPCSPDIEPPYDATRSAAFSTNSRNLPRPALSSSSKSMRTCTQPSPKWP